MLCMIFSVITMGQVTKEGATITPPKFTAVQKVSHVAGQKDNTINDYMLKNVNYPDAAIQKHAMGTEVVAFKITPEGKVTDIKIINSVHPSIDEEVISVLKTTDGMWQPGYIMNEAVAMDNELSLVFRSNERTASDNLKLAQHYFARGSKNLLMKQKPKLALKNFNNGVLLLPNDKSLLVLRGITRFELGDKEGAMNDWTRVKNLGGVVGQDYIERYITMKGYNHMYAILGNN